MLDAVRHALTRLWVALYDADREAGASWLLDCMRCLPASEQSALWRELPGVSLSLGETLHRSGSTEPAGEGRERSVRAPRPARMPRIDGIASVQPVADDRPTEPHKHVRAWEAEREEDWQP